MQLNFDQLKQFVAADNVAIRGTAMLDPVGGPGDKIFPPMHAVDDKNKTPVPMHLVDCLPMRSIVTQTVHRLKTYLEALKPKRPEIDVEFISSLAARSMRNGWRIPTSLGWLGPSSL